VFADDTVLKALDPGNIGQKLSDLGTDCLVWRVEGIMTKDSGPIPVDDYVVEFQSGQVPSKPPTVTTPWIIGNITATSAKPSIRGTIGNIDMPAIIDATVAVAMEI
jgi:hypothetical protein